MLAYLRELENIDRDPLLYHGSSLSDEQIKNVDDEQRKEAVRKLDELRIGSRNSSASQQKGIYEAFAKSTVEKEIISKDEIKALRESVLRENRPKNPWAEKEHPRRSPMTRTPQIPSEEVPVVAMHKEEKPSLLTKLPQQTMQRQLPQHGTRKDLSPNVRTLANSLRNPRTEWSPSTSQSSISRQSPLSPMQKDDRRNYSSPRLLHIPTCAVCTLDINDTILQALGETYHPQCFRCFKCHTCLDNVPFTVADGQILCLNDYRKIRQVVLCGGCNKPIVNSEGGHGAEYEAEYTVRIAGIDKEYHIDCYVCEVHSHLQPYQLHLHFRGARCT
jgi:hypothetical protein